MLVRLMSDLYFDTPVGTIGYVLRVIQKQNAHDIRLYLVRFANNEEEIVEEEDLETIQEK
jgi:hypothetical protein